MTSCPTATTITIDLYLTNHIKELEDELLRVKLGLGIGLGVGLLIAILIILATCCYFLRREKQMIKKANQKIDTRF
ncbi:hypothetical protein I4U23_005339 [Adineta vaga]|nr:hypothetical protein I4U23_005339 [Adineta vaga]